MREQGSGSGAFERVLQEVEGRLGTLTPAERRQEGKRRALRTARRVGRAEGEWKDGEVEDCGQEAEGILPGTSGGLRTVTLTGTRALGVLVGFGIKSSVSQPAPGPAPHKWLSSDRCLRFGEPASPLPHGDRGPVRQSSAIMVARMMGGVEAKFRGGAADGRVQGQGKEVSGGMMAGREGQPHLEGPREAQQRS